VASEHLRENYCVLQVLLNPPDVDWSRVGTTVPNSGLVFADFDVVVDDDGKYDEDPHGENTHSRDGFRDQAWQNRPSTAED